jgi:hypothetical protein
MARTARALLCAGTLALMLGLAAPASAATVDVRGEWDFECGGPCPPQVHNFQSQDPVTGDLAGTGRWADGTRTWKITGKVTESQIQFSVAYDQEPYNATMTGTVSADNQRITGTFEDSNGFSASFTMNRVAGSAPPPPEAGETVNVRPVTGTVTAKCKGDDKYQELDSADQIPVGCLLDTRKGTVNITSEVAEGETNSSWFWQGIFKISQKKGTNQETVVSLAGPLESCSTNKSAVHSAAKRRGRRLWGRGRGRFRTRGRRGSAAVRGTTWLVTDNCDGSTTVRVKDGSVNFRDFVKDKTVVVKEGRTYTARPG